LTVTVAVYVSVWPTTDGFKLEATTVVVAALTVTVSVFEVSESPVALTSTKPCLAPVRVTLATPPETVGLVSPLTVPPPRASEKVMTLELSRVSTLA
jgi:hypothetical protein